eukprot:542864-Hanusia_phi.AAC.1
MRLPPYTAYDHPPRLPAAAAMSSAPGLASTSPVLRPQATEPGASPAIQPIHGSFSDRVRLAEEHGAQSTEVELELADQPSSSDSEIMQCISNMENQIHNKDVQMDCCTKISERSFEHCSIPDLEHKGIDTILRGLKLHPNDAALQAAYIRALVSLSDDDALKNFMHSHGGIETMMGAMKQHSDHATLLRACLCAMASFSSIESNVTSIIDAEGAAILSQTMRKFEKDEDIIYDSLVALANLATTDTSKAAIRQAGGIEAILKTIVDFSSVTRIQRMGFRAISNLMGALENQTAFHQAGGVPILLDALKFNEKDAEILRECCRAVGSLTASEEIIDELIDKEARSAIVHALENHQDDSGLQVIGNWTLARIGFSNKVKVKDRAGLGNRIRSFRDHIRAKQGEADSSSPAAAGPAQNSENEVEHSPRGSCSCFGSKR